MATTVMLNVGPGNESSIGNDKQDEDTTKCSVLHPCFEPSNCPNVATEPLYSMKDNSKDTAESTSDDANKISVKKGTDSIALDEVKDHSTEEGHDEVTGVCLSCCATEQQTRDKAMDPHSDNSDAKYSEVETNNGESATKECVQNSKQNVE